MVVAVSHKPERVSLLGVGVDRVTMDEALSLIGRFIEAGGSHHVVTLDASMCVTAREDGELREIVANADLVTPDSAGVLWACRRLGEPLAQRVSGVEIVERLCAESSEKGIRLFFLGAGPGVAEAAAERMRERYRGCIICGTHDGYFGPDGEPLMIERIRAANPNVLCVAMGIPKQEKWIAQHREELGVPVMIGVGGTFDVISGRVKRAPGWMQRLNLEWLYRLIKNPRKIGKVMMLPRFVLMTVAAARHRTRADR